MTETDTRSTRDLFRAWRSGDAEAGQDMAQRFADWYYAIATSRLGEQRGKRPVNAACERFGQGIVEVTESRALIDWAYGIIDEELDEAGDRIEDADEANAYTGHKRPKALLREAREALPDEMELLEAVYGGDLDNEGIKARAKALGGMPIGVLKARYRLKKWLAAEQGVPFEILPETPNLDLAPLPLYESDHMQSDREEADFEKWMLTDLDLCKDVAEFAHFAIALRGGLAGGEVAPASTARPRTAPGQASAGSGARTGLFALSGAAAVAAILAFLLLVVGGAAAAWLLLS